ncbi:hypothetical protein AB0C02_12200 [Micromonospora sp. NPDC048999]|uniref:hypothetical protein n=1 Tax=Micromonospora sp. NPDC048999 TaxID=3155391 RepID=UPI0033FE9B1E
MATFEEYAALIRALAEQRRAGEHGAAVEADRQRALRTAADQLQRRLAAQGQRLDQLGQAIGQPRPGPPTAPTAPAPATAPAVAPATVLPAGSASAPMVEAAGGGGLPSYPETVTMRLALPSGGREPAAAGLPAPRPPEADPAAELDRARQAADEADRHVQQVEALAQRPALLPSWSPLGRATAVYAGCAAAGALVMMMLVVASGVGLVDGFTLGAWICAGLPALSFFAGYLILGRWGRPSLAAAAPSRYAQIGFLICFAAVPIAYLAYLLIFRVLR